MFDVKNLKHRANQAGDLQKSKKDILQVFGPNPEPHHHEFAQWASKALPNQNWQIWAARNYKQNPKGFTKKVKQTLEHYGGSTHIPEIKELRFEKEHDLEAGVKFFREAEKKYNDRIKDKLNLVRPRSETNLFVKIPNSDHHWYDLGVGSCEAEGKAMGHCGNVPSEHEGDRILSLRKEHVLGGKKYHEPHLTFIYNNGYLGEMKGRANEKPSPKYHKYIVELLKDPRIKGILGGGYQHEKNFKFSDLSPEYQEEALKANPNLITDTESEHNIEKILNAQFPEKHKNVILSAAENPNLDPKSYERLINHEDWQVRETIAEKPNLDPKFYEQLANDEYWMVRAAIAKKPNLDSKLHEQLANDENREVRMAIAKKPNLDSKFHEQFVNDEDWEVREAIAKNPNLNPKFYEKLVNDKNWKVRMAITEKPNLDLKFYEKLANDKDREVREAIAQNPNLDSKFYEKLVNDKDPYVRKAIAQNPNLDFKFHERLANDKDWIVREAIAQNPNLDPKFHEKLVNDKDPYVREAIAKNPNLNPEFHERLASDEDKEVRQAILNNPSYQKKRSATKNEHYDFTFKKSENLAFVDEMLTQDNKEKVSRIVRQIQDNKHIFRPLKNKNPDLYSSVVDLLNALKLLLQHAKHIDNERNIKLTETISNHLKQIEHFAMENETAKVLDALSGNLSQSEHDLEKSTEDKADLLSDPLKVEMGEQDKIKVGEVLSRLKHNKKYIENLAEESPEAYEVIINVIKILSDLFNNLNNEPVEAAEHHFQVQQHLDQVQSPASIKTDVHFKAPPHQEKITHGSKEFPIGAIREYNPQSAREKTPDGRWISVAANVKREDWQ